MLPQIPQEASWSPAIVIPIARRAIDFSGQSIQLPLPDMGAQPPGQHFYHHESPNSPWQRGWQKGDQQEITAPLYSTQPISHLQQEGPLTDDRLRLIIEHNQAHLSYVSINAQEITADTYNALANCHHLREIYLRHAWNLHGDVLLTLLRNNPELSVLHIEYDIYLPSFIIPRYNRDQFPNVTEVYLQINSDWHFTFRRYEVQNLENLFPNACHLIIKGAHLERGEACRSIGKKHPLNT